MRRILAIALLLLAAATAHAQMSRPLQGSPASGGTQPVCKPATRLAALPQTLSMGVIDNGGAGSPGDGWTWAHNAGVKQNVGWAYLDIASEITGGTFIPTLMNNAKTFGLVPIFSFYFTFSSPYNWQNSSFMNNNGSNTGYYQLFQSMLQQIVANGNGYAVIDLEPDSLGTAEQLVAPSLSMSSWSVIVGASGYTGIPNFTSYAPNLAGFIQAMMAIRTAYAPNVPIGYHTAVWGSSNTHNFDPVLAPSASAAFASATDISTWIASSGIKFDLIFYDVSDADSAYNKVVCSSSPTLRLWWGVNNNGEVGPAGTNNFAAYTNWVSDIYTITGLSSFLWQIPSGNTVMRAEDNDLNNNGSYVCQPGICPATGGHFQDDRVQYWVQSGNPNLAPLVNAGVLGLLFSGGQFPGLGFCQPGGANSRTTTQIGNWMLNNDCAAVGLSSPCQVYNPNPIGVSDSNALGLFPGNTTNSGVGTNTDDDGGFLRQQLTQYFANPQPAVCPGGVTVPAVILTGRDATSCVLTGVDGSTCISR